ncbi:hypothetical protein SeMB42_g03712 [Synchytrium endobioticum]|uniref:Pleckstrin homology domain-containing protein n=1 Tax=Synchytrium endobioticum TaxID=286115 RepID=A0A507D534_9FUNG|nr:hypothetical protein SeMB42_g03712 [Synchytrium endobioticum]
MDPVMAGALSQSLADFARDVQIKLKETEKLYAESLANVLDLRETLDMMTNRLSRANREKDNMDAHIYELELRVQRAEEHASDLQACMTRVNHENTRLKADRIAADSRLESLKASEQYLIAAHEKFKTSLDTESQRHKSALASLQRENRELNAKVDELTNLTDAKTVAPDKLLIDVTNLYIDDRKPSATPLDYPHSPTPATQTPTRSSPPSPQRKAFFAYDTLAGSLAHTQSELSIARAELADSNRKLQDFNIENSELRKLLSDAQETIETLRNRHSVSVQSTRPSSVKSPRLGALTSPTKNLHLEMLRSGEICNSNSPDLDNLRNRNRELDNLLGEAQQTISSLRTAMEELVDATSLQPSVDESIIIKLDELTGRISLAAEIVTIPPIPAVSPQADKIIAVVDHGCQTIVESEPLKSTQFSQSNLPIRGLPVNVRTVSERSNNLDHLMNYNMTTSEMATDVLSAFATTPVRGIASSLSSSVASLSPSNTNSTRDNAGVAPSVEASTSAQIDDEPGTVRVFSLPTENGHHPESDFNTPRRRETLMYQFMEQWKALREAQNSERTLIDDSHTLSRGVANTHVTSSVEDATNSFKWNAVECLTQTMIGSWFQKYDRRNKKSHLRYVWVNPYARILNWANQPPSEAGKGIKTRTAFITGIEYRANAPPPSLEPNHPPNLLNAIDISTPERTVRLVPTSWSDYRMWTQGIVLLLDRSRHAVPLHQQFGIVDLDHHDGGEHKDADIASSREESLVDDGHGLNRGMMNIHGDLTPGPSPERPPQMPHHITQIKRTHTTSKPASAASFVRRKWSLSGPAPGGTDDPEGDLSGRGTLLSETTSSSSVGNNRRS